MLPHARDDGLSEVVGFVLLLGVIVVALSLYQVYAVPAAGREDEIAHMNAVKDRFVDYKIALDSLWLNSLNTTRSAEGTTLSTSFDLGTMGGSTQGGGAVIPIFAPIASGGTVSVNEHMDTLTITRDGKQVIAPYSMGEVAYQSSNNYWIQQRYVYQMGGVFLAQDSGTTARLSPPISVYVVNSSTESTLKYGLRVNIAAIQILGGQTTGGQGFARVDTRLQEGMTKITSTGSSSVTVTVDAHDEATAAAWRQVFIDAAVRGGVRGGTEDDTLPVSVIRDGTQVSMICRPVPGEEPTRVQHVDLSVARANFTVALQQATMI